jgi:glycosyltransferase involved in cell wall biosynthesis
MRVLLVSDWPRQAGGVEAYVTWIREGLVRGGDEVRLLTSSAGSAADGTADFVAWGTQRVAVQAMLQIVNPFAVQRVREALRRFRPDVALVTTFAFQLSPAILTALRPVPTVISVADYKFVCPLGTKLLPDHTLCRERAGLVCWRTGCLGLAHWLRDQPRYARIHAAVHGADRVLACSAWIRDALVAHGIAAEHLPPPVPGPGATFVRAPADHPLFVYCGRLSVEKGVLLLVRAFARLRAAHPSARLRVVGEGVERPSLEALVRGLGLADVVTFTGWRSASEVEQALADAWAVVVPSLWAEPLGLVALEAIVRRVPVIASRAGGLGETVEEGVSGLLFPNGDEGALVDCLDALAGGRAFPTHGLADDVVRRAAERHGMEEHLRRLRAVFGELTLPRT